MDISNMSVQQLKALAYDLKIEIEMTQQNFNLVQRQIDVKLREEAEASAAEQRAKDEAMDTVVPPNADETAENKADGADAPTPPAE